MRRDKDGRRSKDGVSAVASHAEGGGGGAQCGREGRAREGEGSPRLLLVYKLTYRHTVAPNHNLLTFPLHIPHPFLPLLPLLLWPLAGITAAVAAAVAELLARLGEGRGEGSETIADLQSL